VRVCYKLLFVRPWKAVYVVVWFSYCLFVFLFVLTCMTVTIMLYNKFPSRNLIRRTGNDATILILTLPFIYLFIYLFIFLFIYLFLNTFFLSSFWIDFLSLSYHFVQTLSKYIFYIFQWMLRIWKVCYSSKLVLTPMEVIDRTKAVTQHFFENSF